MCVKEGGARGGGQPRWGGQSRPCFYSRCHKAPFHEEPRLRARHAAPAGRAARSSRQAAPPPAPLWWYGLSCPRRRRTLRLWGGAWRGVAFPSRQARRSRRQHGGEWGGVLLVAPRVRSAPDVERGRSRQVAAGSGDRPAVCVRRCRRVAWLGCRWAAPSGEPRGSEAERRPAARCAGWGAAVGSGARGVRPERAARCVTASSARSFSAAVRRRASLVSCP